MPIGPIPASITFPDDSVQCDQCGGIGRDPEGVCPICEGKGWLEPATHQHGRRCHRDGCMKPLRPDHIAVYCSNECAWKDA